MATTRANKSTADDNQTTQQENKSESTPRKSTTRSKTSPKATTSTTAKTQSTTGATGTTRRKSTATKSTTNKSTAKSTGTKSGGTKAKSTRAKSSTASRTASTKRESTAKSNAKSDGNPIRAVQEVVSDVRHEVGRAERTWREEISVAGNQLADRVKELAAEGTALRLSIKQDGRVLLEIPLAAAVVGGALTVLAAPILAAITAIGGAVSHVTLEVERKGTRSKASSKK